MLRKVKFWFQRRIRGWDDSDTWSLDYTIAKFILPRLSRFKELNFGVPLCLDGYVEGDIDNNMKLWNNILDKMILAFELVIKGNWEVLTDDEEIQIQEGLKLFGKHFNNLWW